MMQVARSAARAGRALCLPASLIALISVSAVPILPAQLPERAIDSLMARYAQPGEPGAGLLVVHDGQTVLAKGYGLADIEHRVPVTPETNFRLASLSKQFTATAVMLLVADGKLRYDDSVSALVAGLPAFARGVTVRHLLNHTSGLPDYEDFVPDSQTAQVHDADVPALSADAQRLAWTPPTLPDTAVTEYGFGWFIGKAHGITR